MLLGESLVLKLGAVDGFAASAVSSSEITTLEKLMLDKKFYQRSCDQNKRAMQVRSYLNHKLLDYSMEGGALVMQRLA